MSSGQLDVKSLITHRYDIDNAIEAYSILDEPSTLGIIIGYPQQSKKTLTTSRINLRNKAERLYDSELPQVGFIGAGNYASRTLIPLFKKEGATLDTLVTSGGISGVHHGNKNAFLTASTEVDDLLNNNDINTIAIVTRHHLHAAQVVDALNNGKHVFVEKPLALNLEELKLIDKAYQKANNSKPLKLMVGFNRRYAPHIIKMRELLDARQSPKSIIMTINAGVIPSDHWVQDELVGGGRIIGEGCHFIDLMGHLVGSGIKDFKATMVGSAPGIEVRDDKVSITLTFEDGSFGTIHYFANGSSEFPKERIEVFCENAVLQMDNYRVLSGYGWSGFNKMKLLKQDKGQNACVKAFINSISKGTEPPISYDEIMESSRVSIEVANSLRE